MQGLQSLYLISATENHLGYCALFSKLPHELVPASCKKHLICDFYEPEILGHTLYILYSCCCDSNLYMFISHICDISVFANSSELPQQAELSRNSKLLSERVVLLVVIALLAAAVIALCVTCERYNFNFNLRNSKIYMSFSLLLTDFFFFVLYFLNQHLSIDITEREETNREVSMWNSKAAMLDQSWIFSDI